LFLKILHIQGTPLLIERKVGLLAGFFGFFFLQKKSSSLNVLIWTGERKPFHYKLYKTPKELYSAIETAGGNKTQLAWERIFGLGFLAGGKWHARFFFIIVCPHSPNSFPPVYIALGAMTSLMVAAAVKALTGNPLLARTAGAAVFPVRREVDQST
jgi:hypothetical protein